LAREFVGDDAGDLLLDDEGREDGVVGHEQMMIQSVKENKKVSIIK
jgi:hypothetical protein